jgi:hypothetical protein
MQNPLAPERADLPPRQRARFYRELAAEARREAESLTGSAREAYLALAEHWEQRLAEVSK